MKKEFNRYAVGKMVSCSVEIEKLSFRDFSEKDSMNPGARLRSDSRIIEMEAAVSALEYRVAKATKQLKLDKRACLVVRRAVAGLEDEITSHEVQMILETLHELDFKVRSSTSILRNLQDELHDKKYETELARQRRFTDSMRQTKVHLS